MNITDVGHLCPTRTKGGQDGKDRQAGAKIAVEIAEYYTGIFMSDIAELNIEKPEYIPKATEHINEMIEFVKALVDRGYGYETSDGIYFDVMKFKGYGKLSGLDLEGQIAGRGSASMKRKASCRLRALEKSAEGAYYAMPSPWGWDTRAGT